MLSFFYPENNHRSQKLGKVNQFKSSFKLKQPKTRILHLHHAINFDSSMPVFFNGYNKKQIKIYRLDFCQNCLIIDLILDRRFSLILFLGQMLHG